MFVRLARGGPGVGAGGGGAGPGAGGLGLPHAQVVLAGWPAWRLSQSMLSTPLQLNSPAQPAAVHMVPPSLQS
jgi:hypothetical protein